LRVGGGFEVPTQLGNLFLAGDDVQRPSESPLKVLPPLLHRQEITGIFLAEERNDSFPLAQPNAAGFDLLDQAVEGFLALAQGGCRAIGRNAG
jgi:hypothetical protein